MLQLKFVRVNPEYVDSSEWKPVSLICRVPRDWTDSARILAGMLSVALGRYPSKISIGLHTSAVLSLDLLWRSASWIVR